MIEWPRLLDLRERRRRLALEIALADRRAADLGASAARAAEAALAQAKVASATHWKAASADPALSVASLAGAAAWSRVLDERTAHERVAVAEARAWSQRCENALAQSREDLHRAAAGVEKLMRLSGRARALDRRLEDARLEATADDLAAARWAMRRTRRD